MALNNISADLLPALEPMGGEQHGEELSAHSLPHIAWDGIAHYLSHHTATLLIIATFSQDLKDICRPHLSKQYETLSDGDRFLYHRVLQLVLQGYVDPSYIYEVNCSDARPYRETFKGGKQIFEEIKYDCDAIPWEADTKIRQRHVFGLFRETLRASLWIPQVKEDEICEHFQLGEPDAALAVLLPLCTKLKTLQIPQRSYHCAAVVQAVAQAYRQRAITGAEARRSAWEAVLRDRTRSVTRNRTEPDALPFSELVVLYNQDHNFVGFALSLAEATAFIGIPSLHRVVLEAVRDPDFASFAAWPADHVECSCPEIWLQKSACSRGAILAFAQGMTGPCEIRQQFDLHGSWVQKQEDCEVTWDTVLVRHREDGSKNIETRIAYEGGDPGYDHAWVSWMFWGKMKDWRRLDEEFSLQKGDDKVIELGAGL